MNDEIEARPMAAVRLENFRDDTWQVFLNHRLFRRYPGARVVSRRPQIVLVELRMGGAWSPADDAFFAAMKQEGFFQRWEPLPELPPQPKRDQASYADIGYRVGAGERLTAAQQEALFSQLHDMEERTLQAEKIAEEQQIRAVRAEEHANMTVKIYNELIRMLDTALQIKVSGDAECKWEAEDAESGKILLRAETLAELYRRVVVVRFDKGGRA